jgi:hypothetical protein
VTQFTSVLHAGFLISSHNFLTFLCFNKRCKSGNLYFGSRIVVLLINSLYAEAIDAAESSAALSALLEE